MRRLVAVLFAALVVLSGAVAGVGTAAAQESDDDSVEPADEVYVSENGDAVLVYENQTEDNTRVEYGLDVGQSIFHALVVTNTTESSGLEGSATAMLSPNRFTGNGSLTAERPTELRSLDVDLEGKRTAEDARFDLTADATLDSGEAPSMSMFRSAQTNGNITVTADSITSSGELSAQSAMRMGEPAAHGFSVTESDGSYTVEATQSYTVREWQRSRWNTSERARQTLESQYATVAQGLGGTATVTLDSYQFTETSSGRHRLDISYTVQYENIEQGLVRYVAQSAAQSESLDLSESEARALGQRAVKVNIDRLDVKYRQADGSIHGAYSLSISNYDELVFAALDAAESVKVEDEASAERIDAQLQKFRTRFEAQQAADLVRKVSWSASVEQVSTSQTDLSASVRYRTENWDAYVSELESRDVKRADVTYEFHAATEGEEVTANASVEIEREGLVRELTDGALNLLESSDTQDQDVTDARELVQAFRDAKLQKARMDVSVQDGTVRFEAGGSFDDLAPFRDVLTSTQNMPKVTSAVGRTENGTTRSYVRVTGEFPENATEEDVRAAAFVDEDTTVHLPGTWNRTFPEMDVKGASEYLGVEYDTPTPDQSNTTDSSGPGFGAAAALLAVALAALLARRD